MIIHIPEDCADDEIEEDIRDVLSEIADLWGLDQFEIEVEP